MKKKRNQTLNSKKIKFIIKNNELIEPYDLNEIGYYLTNCPAAKDKKSFLATIDKMKKRFEYAYYSSEALYKYIQVNKTANEYAFIKEDNSSNKWLFTNYDLNTFDKLELNPTWFNTDELLICLETMKKNGLGINDYEFLIENIKNYNFEKHTWNISRRILSQLETRYIFLNSFHSPYKTKSDIYIFENESTKRVSCTDGLFRFEKNRLKRYIEYKKLVNEYENTPYKLSKKRQRLRIFLSHLHKPDYEYKQLSVYSKQYKKMFRRINKQYSKWQTQQIMKQYLNIIHKMTEPLKDNPIEFDEDYDLGNDGFGYHDSITNSSIDNEEIVQEMRDEAWWEEEQERMEYEDALRNGEYEERPWEYCKVCGKEKWVDEKVCEHCEMAKYEVCEECGYDEKLKGEDCDCCASFSDDYEDNESDNICNECGYPALDEKGECEYCNCINELRVLIKEIYGVNYEDIQRNNSFLLNENLSYYVSIENGIKHIVENYEKNLKNDTYVDTSDGIYSFLTCKNMYMPF